MSSLGSLVSAASDALRLLPGVGEQLAKWPNALPTLAVRTRVALGPWIYYLVAPSAPGAAVRFGFMIGEPPPLLGFNPDGNVSVEVDPAGLVPDPNPMSDANPLSARISFGFTHARRLDRPEVELMVVMTPPAGIADPAELVSCVLFGVRAENTEKLPGWTTVDVLQPAVLTTSEADEVNAIVKADVSVARVAIGATTGPTESVQWFVGVTLDSPLDAVSKVADALLHLGLLAQLLLPAVFLPVLLPTDVTGPEHAVAGISLDATLNADGGNVDLPITLKTTHRPGDKPVRCVPTAPPPPAEPGVVRYRYGVSGRSPDGETPVGAVSDPVALSHGGSVTVSGFPVFPAGWQRRLHRQLAPTTGSASSWLPVADLPPGAADHLDTPAPSGPRPLGNSLAAPEPALALTFTAVTHPHRLDGFRVTAYSPEPARVFRVNDGHIDRLPPGTTQLMISEGVTSKPVTIQLDSPAAIDSMFVDASIGELDNPVTNLAGRVWQIPAGGIGLALPGEQTFAVMVGQPTNPSLPLTTALGGFALNSSPGRARPWLPGAVPSVISADVFVEPRQVPDPYAPTPADEQETLFALRAGAAKVFHLRITQPPFDAVVHALPGAVARIQFHRDSLGRDGSREAFTLLLRCAATPPAFHVNFSDRRGVDLTVTADGGPFGRLTALLSNGKTQQWRRDVTAPRELLAPLDRSDDPMAPDQRPVSTFDVAALAIGTAELHLLNGPPNEVTDPEWQDVRLTLPMPTRIGLTLAGKNHVEYDGDAPGGLDLHFGKGSGGIVAAVAPVGPNQVAITHPLAGATARDIGRCVAFHVPFLDAPDDWSQATLGWGVVAAVPDGRTLHVTLAGTERPAAGWGYELREEAAMGTERGADPPAGFGVRATTDVATVSGRVLVGETGPFPAVGAGPGAVILLTEDGAPAVTVRSAALASARAESFTSKAVAALDGLTDGFDPPSGPPKWMRFDMKFGPTRANRSLRVLQAERPLTDDGHGRRAMELRSGQVPESVDALLALTPDLLLDLQAPATATTAGLRDFELSAWPPQEHHPVLADTSPMTPDYGFISMLVAQAPDRVRMVTGSRPRGSHEFDPGWLKSGMRIMLSGSGDNRRLDLTQADFALYGRPKSGTSDVVFWNYRRLGPIGNRNAPGIEVEAPEGGVAEIDIWTPGEVWASEPGKESQGLELHSNQPLFLRLVSAILDATIPWGGHVAFSAPPGWPAGRAPDRWSTQWLPEAWVTKSEVQLAAFTGWFFMDEDAVDQLFSGDHAEGGKWWIAAHNAPIPVLGDAITLKFGNTPVDWSYKPHWR